MPTARRALTDAERAAPATEFGPPPLAGFGVLRTAEVHVALLLLFQSEPGLHFALF